VRDHLRHRAGGLAARAPRADRSVRPPLVRFPRSFPSAFAGRAVPPEGNQPPGHPAPALVAAGAQADMCDSPVRFFAPRVSAALHQFIWRRRPSGSFVAAFRFGARTGLAVGLLSRPGRDSLVPATPMGFASRPSQYCSRPRVTTPLQRLAPTCRFAAKRPPRVSSIAGPTDIRRVMSVGPRLLGFGPADEPYRVTCRSRKSFCAQGRAGRPAKTALGFGASLGCSPPAIGLHFWNR